MSVEGLGGTVSSPRTAPLRLALPSDGELHQPSLDFLGACGLPVERASLRRYTAALGSVADTVALLQRAADIPSKVEEGSADLGIVGLDRYLESRVEEGDSLVLLEDLAFGRCELVIAVPDLWVDVVSTRDLADLAVEFREAGRELRIATKYPRLVQNYLYAQGVNYFTLVLSSGTLEAAPAMGYADLIADLSASGATLRENGLKTLEDGSVLTSQACLIGNRRFLALDEAKLEGTRAVLERMEAHLRAQNFCSITANVQGSSPEAVAAHIVERGELAGVRGPTLASVFTPASGGWYAATIVVERKRLLEAVEHLRRLGGNGITVSSPTYLFHDDCEAYRRLESALSKE